jgi:AcrR family transcriptional regulator
METRTVILEKAAELLARSVSGDISTRAVCDAAGITQPVLYRLFGDKYGLLAAVVDYVWDQYLSMKRAAQESEDPLEDLLAGWDSHVAFALEHPHAYRLLFATALATATDAGQEAMRLLEVHLNRLAGQGRLQVPPADAARIVMAANTGVSLALLLRRDQYPDFAVSTQMRDTVYRSLLVTNTARPAQAASVAATTLRSALSSEVPHMFSPPEAALLNEWLKRIEGLQNPK